MITMKGKGATPWHGVAIFAAACCVLAWTAFHGFERLSAYWTEQHSAEHDLQPSARPGINRDYDIARIAGAHIFGRPEKAAAPKPEHAPETKLRISLLGLVASANDRLSRAIINVDGAKPKPYTVGQTIEGTDAAVHAVEENRVLLRRGDALESLVLKRSELPRSGPVNASRPASRVNRGSNGNERRAGQTRSESAAREQLQSGQIKQPF